MSEKDDFELFVTSLIASLTHRYDCCPRDAAPDTILLSVLNAVHDARGDVMAERAKRSSAPPKGGSNG